MCRIEKIMMVLKCLLKYNTTEPIELEYHHVQYHIAKIILH